MSLRQLALSIAARQRGVVTRRQLLGSGMTTGQIRSLVRDGTLLWEADGVYRSAGASRTYEQTVTLALAAAGPGAVASHGCAARLMHLGVPSFNAAGPAITVPAAQHASDARKFAVVHRSRHLDARDTGLFQGLPSTTPLRVAVDCAALAGISQDAYRALVDDVLFQFGTPGKLRSAWARSGRRSGKAWMEDALAPYVPGATPDSSKEMSLARVCWAGGLPLPERQVTIVDPRSGAVIARCDLGYRDARLGLEYLGQRFHAPRHRASDVNRHEHLDVLDWAILYARKADLVTPQSTRFVAAVAACLIERLPMGHPTRRSAELVVAKRSS